jgi:hypothetical protein
VDFATVTARLGHSSVRTTADIYSHAIRGKDHAAAQCWDDIIQRSRGETEKSKTVNYCLAKRISGPKPTSRSKSETVPVCTSSAPRDRNARVVAFSVAGCCQPVVSIPAVSCAAPRAPRE